MFIKVVVAQLKENDKLTGPFLSFFISPFVFYTSKKYVGKISHGEQNLSLMEIERETLEEGKIKVKGYTSGWWGKEIKTLPVNYVGALENRSS